MIDLRSDTVTAPDTQMRAAMAAAEVGDDVYGEDPTVNALQERVAAMFGHEAALWTPTGSMANQLAVQIHIRPGEEFLADVDAHVLTYELGAAAAFGGATSRTYRDVSEVASMIRPEGYHAVRTAAVFVENTHNRKGGSVLPLDALVDLRALALDAGITVHCDGARIWNAHVATGVALAEYGRQFDTLMVSLSKGLGAPAGSLLVGSRERIERAIPIRKRMGGGMRQVGIYAAAGLHALNNIERLGIDHRRAARLADALGVTSETNIVALSVPDAPDLGRRAQERGVAISVLGPTFARLVTHLDVDDAGIDRAVEVLTSELNVSPRT
ncbi:MAG: aminotransferase class I/II-fold pyridoxal phosphate-dependent enzyme [Longispora sp.]|nr:aminotransferase class I/II-fold pyridoxal phosphate-dependent enzyme [Longispora sp. (in: high G+C Gram-positive bacteria)]